jgi:hypothetical protein
VGNSETMQQLRDRIAQARATAHEHYPSSNADPAGPWRPKPDMPAPKPLPAVPREVLAASFPRPTLLMSVARTLPATFSIEDLTVRAWQAYPTAFGMARWPHPDSNKVISLVVGARGLVARGWLEKVGPKTYRVKEQA